MRPPIARAKRQCLLKRHGVFPFCQLALLQAELNQTAARHSFPRAPSAPHASRRDSRAPPAASFGQMRRSRETVQQRGHPPGEALRLPDAAEAGCRIVRSPPDDCSQSARSKRLREKRTSAAARFRPLAPVGGTMCAASPAKKSFPQRIGSATKLLTAAMLFSIEGQSPSPPPPTGRAGGAARRRSARRARPRCSGPPPPARNSG